MTTIKIDLIEEKPYLELLKVVNKFQEMENKPKFTLEQLISMILSENLVLGSLKSIESIITPKQQENEPKNGNNEV